MPPDAIAPVIFHDAESHGGDGVRSEEDGREGDMLAA